MYEIRKDDTNLYFSLVSLVTFRETQIRIKLLNLIIIYRFTHRKLNYR